MNEGRSIGNVSPFISAKNVASFGIKDKIMHAHHYLPIIFPLKNTAMPVIIGKVLRNINK